MANAAHFFSTPDAGENASHTLAYLQWGDPENPRVLLCMHGLTRNARDFDYLAQSLSQHYRVICPDMPGRGNSEWFSDKSRYHYGTYLADTMALLSHLNIKRCDWVGTSMGGIIGMMVAGGFPGLIGKLVLNDIGPFISKAGLARIIQYVSAVPTFDDEKAAEHYLRTIFSPFGITDETQWQHLFTYGLQRTPEGKITLAYDPGIIEPFKTATKNLTEINDIDLWPVWENITCPVLVLRGEQSDILAHDMAEKMRASRPHVMLVEFPGIGHAPALMDKDQIARIADWLAE